MPAGRKEKSRYAARNRRTNENIQYGELSKLLPLPASLTTQLDKASIIRLTTSFLRYRDLTGREVLEHRERTAKQEFSDKELLKIKNKFVPHLIQALDGFLFVVNEEGKIVYISDTIYSYLGITQIDLVGMSIYSYIHPDDHKEFSQLLTKHKNIPINSLDGISYEEEQHNINRGFISIFIRMKCNPDKRVINKNNGFKVVHISGNTVLHRHLDKDNHRPFSLVATGQLLPPPTICELKLDTKVFVSRVGMDLKISYCEGKIRKYMDFTAKDIVGLSAYEFYHLNDMMVVQEAHSDCINSGKCVSRNYRWMNKLGGWVQMQTVGTVITRRTAEGEKSEILCINYINSEIENEHEVMHSIQQRFKKLQLRSNNKAEKKESKYNDASFHTESILVPANDKNVDKIADVKDQTAAVDKNAYILSIKYTNQSIPGRRNDGLPMIEEIHTLPSFSTNSNNISAPPPFSTNSNNISAPPPFTTNSNNFSDAPTFSKNTISAAHSNHTENYTRSQNVTSVEMKPFVEHNYLSDQEELNLPVGLDSNLTLNWNQMNASYNHNLSNLPNEIINAMETDVTETSSPGSIDSFTSPDFHVDENYTKKHISTTPGFMHQLLNSPGPEETFPYGQVDNSNMNNFSQVEYLNSSFPYYNKSPPSTANISIERNIARNCGLPFNSNVSTTHQDSYYNRPIIDSTISPQQQQINQALTTLHQENSSVSSNKSSFNPPVRFSADESYNENSPVISDKNTFNPPLRHSIDESFNDHSTKESFNFPCTPTSHEKKQQPTHLNHTSPFQQPFHENKHFYQNIMSQEHQHMLNEELLYYRQQHYNNLYNQHGS